MESAFLFRRSSERRRIDPAIPFSKGGSSLTAANVRLLCAKHNLEKSDKILSIGAVGFGWSLSGLLR